MIADPARNPRCRPGVGAGRRRVDPPAADGTCVSIFREAGCRTLTPAFTGDVDGYSEASRCPRTGAPSTTSTAAAAVLDVVGHAELDDLRPASRRRDRRALRPAAARGGGRCVSSTGRGGCARGRSLDVAWDIALSPDGRFLYVASYASAGVAIFRRNTRPARCASSTAAPAACAASPRRKQARERCTYLENRFISDSVQLPPTVASPTWGHRVPPRRRDWHPASRDRRLVQAEACHGAGRCRASAAAGAPVDAERAVRAALRRRGRVRVHDRLGRREAAAGRLRAAQDERAVPDTAANPSPDGHAVAGRPRRPRRQRQQGRHVSRRRRGRADGGARDPEMDWCPCGRKSSAATASARGGAVVGRRHPPVRHGVVAGDRRACARPGDRRAVARRRRHVRRVARARAAARAMRRGGGHQRVVHRAADTRRQEPAAPRLRRGHAAAPRLSARKGTVTSVARAQRSRT